MQAIISIHSLRMEGDISGTIDWDGDETFQSTPSAWRETGNAVEIGDLNEISIHSLRMEGDRRHEKLAWRICHFNPLPPHGGRLRLTPSTGWGEHISIHSLRMEGDEENWSGKALKVIISIHSLRMEGDILLS